MSDAARARKKMAVSDVVTAAKGFIEHYLVRVGVGSIRSRKGIEQAMIQAWANGYYAREQTLQEPVRLRKRGRS